MENSNQINIKIDKTKFLYTIIVILILVIIGLSIYIINMEKDKCEVKDEKINETRNTNNNNKTDIPIINQTDNNKKDQMLDDAKKIISLAKFQVNKSFDIRNGELHLFLLEELNMNNDIGKDPDGGEYDHKNSYVKYENKNNKISYCIVLIGSKRSIGNTNNCINESILSTRNNVTDNN